jgi:16S rRNA (cytosine1402-N4)-methyltransferase
METPESLVYHKPVLMSEVLEYLAIKPGKTYVDVTFGTGGHTRAILEKEPTCSVIALDWDADELERYGGPLKEEFGDRLTLVWGNFAVLYKLLKKAGASRVDGILADFGTSQIQIAERKGVSFSRDTALDMRLSPAHFQETAADVVNTMSEKALRELFWELGEEQHARPIARAIVLAREKKRITTTGQLVEIIKKSMPSSVKKRHTHPATKVFQALRMHVNKELENMQSFLIAAVRALKPQGRLVCISFHSLEDRQVKQFFRDQERLLALEVITPKVVRATPEEVAINPSSRSACLRVAEKKND